ncbi:carbon-nitrogen hydrolase family protein [Deltaproteobacteria bacterium TL4]
MTHLIGLAQVNASAPLQDNLDYALHLIQEAHEAGVSLIAFPEMFLYVGEDKAEKLRLAQSLDGEFVQRFQGYARQYNLSILMGSFYEKVSDERFRTYNTSVLIDREGEIKGVYRKIHLCDIDSPQLKNVESQHIKAGSEVVVVEHEIGKIGLSICYDLRFPGLYQHLVAKGAEIIFVPAAFFLHTGKDHWFPLLQARAIENQVFIAAPAQWGWHYGTRISYGRTVLINPWGTIVACAPDCPGLIIGKLDLDYLMKVRRDMPVQNHQRNECYGVG